MDDISAAISQILSDPDSMRQIQDIASSLGLGGITEQSPPALQAPPAPPAQAAQNAGAPDLSALSALLGNLGGGQPPVQSSPAPDLSALAGLLGNLGVGQPSVQSSPAPDLSALSGLLGNLGAGQNTQKPAAPGSNFDVSALASLLNSGNPPAAGASGNSGGFDINMLLKAQQAMASLQNSRSDINLLMALKPRLKDERAKKVDDAIKVMQLVQFLPLIKESGLFGDMDNILGGITGGLGGLAGGGQGRLNGILGSLLGKRK